MERILCAAIWYKEQPQIVSHYNPINVDKGVVLCGFRHHNIIGQCISLLDKPQYQMGEYIPQKCPILNTENKQITINIKK